MARQPRIEYEGAIYHVISRGNNRERIFHGMEDCELFLRVLQEAVERFGLDVLSYCLMPNHYHLAMRTPGGNLSQAMAWMQTTFAARYRNRHKRVGHIFQGRYKAQLVETGDYLRTLILYIHLNPIRTRKGGKLYYSGTHDDLNRFRWSSHGAYTGRSTPDWLNIEPLTLWGRTEKRARTEYRRVIKELVTKEPLDWNDHLQHGMLAGGETFIAMIKDKLSRKPTLSVESGMSQLTKMKAESRKAILASMLEDIDDQRMVIWARVKLQMERPVDLAREKGYRDGGSILQIVKRVEQRSQNDSKTRETIRRLKNKVSSVEV